MDSLIQLYSTLHAIGARKSRPMTPYQHLFIMNCEEVGAPILAVMPDLGLVPCWLSCRRAEEWTGWVVLNQG